LGFTTYVVQFDDSSYLLHLSFSELEPAQATGEPVDCDYCGGLGYIDRVHYGGSAGGGFTTNTCPKCKGKRTLPIASEPVETAASGDALANHSWEPQWLDHVQITDGIWHGARGVAHQKIKSEAGGIAWHVKLYYPHESAGRVLYPTLDMLRPADDTLDARDTELATLRRENDALRATLASMVKIAHDPTLEIGAKYMALRGTLDDYAALSSVRDEGE
jgi:hypothetical protein